MMGEKHDDTGTMTVEWNDTPQGGIEYDGKEHILCNITAR